MSATTALKQALPGAEPRPMTSYDILKLKLEAARQDLRAYLGSDMAVARFINTVISATVERPELIEADMRSLLVSAKKAAIDGLMPDGREATFNVYNTRERDSQGRERWVKKVQYLPMVAGLIKLIYEAGATYVDAAAVYEKDLFRFIRGDVSSLVHEPYLGDDPGEIIAAYVVVRMASGEIKREVMPRRDIDKVRAASKAAEKGPWVTWFDQMAIKSVIKRAQKQLPRSDKLDSAIAADNEAVGAVGSLFDIAPASEQSARAQPAALEDNPSPRIHPEGFHDAQDGEAFAERMDSGPIESESAAPPEEMPAVSQAKVVSQLNKALKAKDLDLLDVAAGLIDAIPDEKHREETREIYRAHREKLGA